MKINLAKENGISLPGGEGGGLCTVNLSYPYSKIRDNGFLNRDNGLLNRDNGLVIRDNGLDLFFSLSLHGFRRISVQYCHIKKSS